MKIKWLRVYIRVSDKAEIFAILIILLRLFLSRLYKEFREKWVRLRGESLRQAPAVLPRVVPLI
jgi:hypothetical protein